MSNTQQGVVTTTRSLAVNAAFMKDIKDDNRELKSLLDRLTPMTEHPRIAENHWSEIIGLLSDLCDQLALHFSLEEAYGYFDQAIETEPQMTVVAEALRNEHPTLFEAARGLADSAPDVDATNVEKVEAFLKRLAKFRKVFEKHEESELKLILDALDDDIGVGD